MTVARSFPLIPSRYGLIAINQSRFRGAPGRSAEVLDQHQVAARSHGSGVETVLLSGEAPTRPLPNSSNISSLPRTVSRPVAGSRWCSSGLLKTGGVRVVDAARDHVEGTHPGPSTQATTVRSVPPARGKARRGESPLPRLKRSVAAWRIRSRPARLRPASRVPLCPPPAGIPPDLPSTVTLGVEVDPPAVPGEKDGACSSPVFSVRRRGVPPATSIVQMSECPSWPSEPKAMRRPSGDQAGVF